MDASSRPTRPLLCTAALLAWGLLPIGASTGWPARLNATLRNDAPNARDYERIEHGYYERLIDDHRPRAVAPAPFDAGVLAQTVADVREYVLKPNLSTTHKGASWTTNDLGMRDASYSKTKPPHTFRIALVGDSIAAGWGVDDGLGFEPIAERTWNRRSTQADGPTVEVLNFAVPGHAPGQRWEHFRRVGPATSPDLVLFESTLADLGWDERRLRTLLPRGIGFDSPVYRDALTSLRTAPSADFKARLRPHRDAILEGVYRRVVADCREQGIPVVWVLLPRVGKPVIPGDRASLIGLARSAGFDRLIDVSDAFEGQSAASLAIAADDFHPNVAGHARLAHRLDAELGEFVSSAARSSRPKGGEPPSVSGRTDPAHEAVPPPSPHAGVAPR